MMPTNGDIRAMRRLSRWRRENRRPHSKQDIERRRGFSWGIAGAAFVMLAQLLQAPSLDQALVVTACAAAVAIACATFDALQMELYISVGEQGLPHVERYFACRAEWLATRGAVTSLLVAVMGVVWH